MNEEGKGKEMKEEGEGKEEVSGGGVFRVFFRGLRFTSDWWCDTEGRHLYEYNDFFIVDILNEGLPVDDIILDIDSDDDDVIEESDVEDGDEEEGLEEEEREREEREREEKKKETESKKEGDCGVSDELALKPFCDSLMTCVGECNILRINSSIYFFANWFISQSRILNRIKDVSSGKYINCLKHLARIDLDSNDKQWMLSALQPELSGCCFQSVVFGDNIYLFDSSSPIRCQLYDTLLNTCSEFDSELPSHLQKCYMSSSLIPDLERKRVLVHLSFDELQTATVYAWYPNHAPQDPPWVPLIPSFPTLRWKKKKTIADGLLFFYYRKTTQLFEAYDLVTDKWLKIKWPTAIPPFLTRWYRPKSMFYMGNGKLCVALSICVSRPVLGSNVYFVVFKFTRSKNRRIIFIRHNSLKLFHTSRISNTLHYVPLD